MDDVKTRNYDTSRRTKRTMATRLRVIEAARDLFLERGYPVTSIEAIAAAADVAPATLYRLFPSKRDLLKAVVDVSAVGDDEPVALHERPELLALRDERDPSAYVRGFAHVARVVGERAAGIQQMLRSAALVDSEAAEMLATLNQQRYTGQGIVARGVRDRGALKSSLNEEEATDVIYGLMSPELRRILRHERAWTAERYETWLGDILCAALLE